MVLRIFSTRKIFFTVTQSRKCFSWKQKSYDIVINFYADHNVDQNLLDRFKIKYEEFQVKMLAYKLLI